MKVYQEADSLVSETEIRQELSFVNRQDLFDCFDFCDDLVFDDKIKPITAIELDLFIRNRERFLLFDPESSLL